MFGLSLHTTLQHIALANALDRDHQDHLLAELLYFSQKMVSLPQMMILALGTAVMAVLTRTMAPALI